MRNRKHWCLVFVFLFLSGCAGEGGNSSQNALQFRTACMGAEACSFTAKITADYEDRCYDFSLDCVCSVENSSLHVTSPESIAGISAVVSGDGTAIEFDGVELTFGEMANGHVSPVCVPWLLFQCWTGAYIGWSGMDGDLERVTYLHGYDEEMLTVDTWFSDRLPVRAEVLYGDRRWITVAIENFTMN